MTLEELALWLMENNGEIRFSTPAFRIQCITLGSDVGKYRYYTNRSVHIDKGIADVVEAIEELSREHDQEREINRQ